MAYWPSSKIGFGKYNGQIVNDIIEEDPDYVLGSVECQKKCNTYIDSLSDSKKVLVFLEIMNVLLGQGLGVDAFFQREVLGMYAEGVEAHGLEQVVALQFHETAVNIGADEGEAVAHMQPLRGGVGEHHQIIERIGSISKVASFSKA